MGAISIGENQDGPWENYCPYGWQFTDYPKDGLRPKEILWEMRKLFQCRMAHDYKGSDAISESLRKYGVILEYEKDRIRAKW
jgi:hypothetical protein